MCKILHLLKYQNAHCYQLKVSGTPLYFSQIGLCATHTLGIPQVTLNCDLVFFIISWMIMKNILGYISAINSSTQCCSSMWKYFIYADRCPTGERTLVWIASMAHYIFCTSASVLGLLYYFQYLESFEGRQSQTLRKVVSFCVLGCTSHLCQCSIQWKCLRTCWTMVLGSRRCWKKRHMEICNVLHSFVYLHHWTLRCLYLHICYSPATGPTLGRNSQNE